MKTRHLFFLAATTLLAGLGTLSGAAVTPREAARLKADLTPLGAERAGNAAGTIPAWTGGYTHVWPGYVSGQPRPDPFPDEKPLFRVTAKNMAKYADHLTEGLKALLKRFPTFRLDVYPTHRTAAAPQWVYDNTFRNATRAKIAHNGMAVENAYGGIPFPIPRNGLEAIWNHLLAWKGESISYDYNSYLVRGGTPVLMNAGRLDSQFPYYYRNGSLASFKGIFFYFKLTRSGPALHAGENFLSEDPIDFADESRKTWQYMVGQRRVRRAPNVAYDTPNFMNSGFTYFDEAYLYSGSPDRYEWKLLGKREMFIPYNENRLSLARMDQVLGPHHLNPDLLRWELHRVWVVEATLAPGKRHVMPKRRFYLDEDTWEVMLSDSWDAKGQLWHVGYASPLVAPEFPVVGVPGLVIHDLIQGGYLVEGLLNNGKRFYQKMPRRPEDEFTPAALAGEGIR